MIRRGGGGRPAVIIDGAHNEDAARALRETARRYLPDKRILLVTGMLAEKQVDRMLDQLTEITTDVIVTEPDSPRRLEAEKLADHLRAKGTEPLAVVREEECVRKAEELGQGYDAVIFSGSLYLIGNVRRRYGNEQGKQSQQDTALL